MTSLLIADWCPLGRDGYFRKIEVYTMGWQQEVNLNAVTLTCASYGGPVAVMRDRSKLIKIQGSGKPVISIYTSSGKLISSFAWNSGQLVQLGWSSTDDLLCVLEDGAVLMYDMFGTYQHTFGMGQEAQDKKVIEAKIFASPAGTGVAVLTSTYRIFLVNSVKEPKIRRLPEIPGAHIVPNTWAVVCEERHTRVLLARDCDFFSLIEGETMAVQQVVDFGDDSTCIVAMAVSPRYAQLALLNDHGRLWIGSTDLRTRFRLYDTRNIKIPKQMIWCGLDCVVMNWESLVEVIGCYDDTLKYTYDTPVHLVQETDCARAITPVSHDLLQKVPQVVQDIFRINSTSPGSYLLEASKQFEKKSHRANEYIHLVKPRLSFAVHECIEAAGHEFDPNTQKMLIKAAQFGKSFICDYDPEKYVLMCRVLRALNAVRDPKIGLPITYEQLVDITLQSFIDILVRRRQYFLAIQIAKYLQMPDCSSILNHWAIYKVKQSQLDREQVAREIAEKLGRSPGVSYTEIAKKAADFGRTQLAIKLLDYEPRATLQVPLLLHLGQDRVALVKAIESGNTDLVYTVLLHLRENMPLGKFQMEIRNFPLAQALYLKYCREHNRETLRDVYMQEDEHNAQAACFIRDSYDPKNSAIREASLVAAQESFKRARNDVHATLCEEQLKLNKYQRTLEEKFNKDFVNKSLHDTLYALLSMQEVKLADKLRSEYKVPDRRYWWLRVKVLAELRDWAELEKFSKSKKSPIGYEPFVDACLENENKFEAAKYMPKVRDEQKVKYYCKLGMMDEARQTAMEQRDLDALQYVQSKTGETPESAAQIAALSAQLNK